MDFQSQETIQRLNAEAERALNDDDGNDDSGGRTNKTVSMDNDFESQPQAPSIAQSNRISGSKKRLTSPVWDDFSAIGKGSDGKEKGTCNHCGKIYTINTSKNGTTTLQRHLDVCRKKPRFADVGNMMVDQEGKLRARNIDHKVNRDMTSEIIIYHDLPFSYVEYEKVRARDKYLNPDCKHICRKTAATDVYKRYLMEKEKLKSLLGRHQNRVCFTSDLWTARVTCTGYICLTAHFIDDLWRLNSKILAFCPLKPPHTGDEIAKKILDCLQDWGLEKKVFSITLDNAYNNDSMQTILKRHLLLISGRGLLCDGKFLHVRCSAHILNLIVKEGLALINSLLHNIRESVKYVKASDTRRIAFSESVERVGIKSGAGLSLDVSTRWNSTYEMLARAIKFRSAFTSMQLYDRSYKFLPSDAEWDQGQRICEFLKPFNTITTYFSGSKYPTSNVYFMQVWRIEVLLKKYSRSEDVAMKELAVSMHVKFEKYWDEYSIILAMGAVLDPRLKLQMLKSAYDRVDPTTSTAKIEEVKNNLYLLYEEYRKKSQTSSSVEATLSQHDVVSEAPLEDDDFNHDLFELESDIHLSSNHTKSNLDVYLEEHKMEMKSFPDIDVLSYWKDNRHRFGDLASMASDILSIPITTVASESTFSIGGRVLNPYRNRLLPENVQALLCTRNWLRGFSEIGADNEGEDDDEENGDMEQEE